MASLPSSTALRLAAYYSLAFTILLLLLGAGLYLGIRGELRIELDQRVRAERALVLRDASGADLAAVVAARTAHRSGDMWFALLDRRGRRVAGSQLTTLPGPGLTDVHVQRAEGAVEMRGLASRTADGDTLVVAVDPEAVEELDEHMVPLLVITFGLAAIVGIGGAFVLGKLLSKRLDALGLTAEAIIGGDLARRMPVSARSDEFDRLSVTLNRMLDRIGDLLANLRQVSGDIAHDLRTPLSRLRQKLELGLTSGGGENALRSAMIDALEQSEEALALFAGLLSVAEVEAGGLRLSPLDLSALASDLVDGYRPSVEDTGRSLDADIAPSVSVRGNRELLAQLVSNLLDNALIHSPNGVPISVCLTGNEVDAVLTVADHGPGIARADRARVFDRFVRLEGSRSTPGYGLGLSLVAATARAHRGVVRIEDNHPGAKMIVTLPRNVA